MPAARRTRPKNSKSLKKTCSFICLLILPALLFAQQATQADTPVPGRTQVDTPVSIHGFGGKLILTGGPSCLILPETSSSDFGRVRTLEFPLPYDSLLHQLSRDPGHFVFWEKFGVQNNSDSALDLSVNCGDLNYIDLFLLSPGHPGRWAQGGNLRRAAAGSSYVQHRSAALPLRLGPHQSGELFLEFRQRTDEFNFGGVDIYSPDALNTAFAKDAEDDSHFLFFELLFLGFMICQVLYVLFQWMIIRRREYMYYFFYLAVLTLYFLSKQETQYGIYFLFSRHPLWKVYLGKTLLILPYFFYFRFIRSFLEMPANYPVLNKWIVKVEYFLLAYTLFDLAFILISFDRKGQTEIYTIVLLLVFLLATVFMVYMYRQRKVLAYYIVSGSLFVGTGHIMGLIFSYFEFVRHIDLGVPDIFIFSQVGIVLEICCFTAGLSYKSHADEKEKIRSQENLIEQLKANELLQSRMQYIRNKIAQDLHDDIGSTLSSISILSGLALEDKNSGHTLETMSEIKDSSILLMERMDDIVWSINPRNDSLENLLMRIKHFATTLFEAREIDYSIDIQENINAVRLPTDYRQHIYLVLKEAINNLVKYSQATQAAIQVGFDRQILELSVRDNGRGFVASGESRGNGIPGMRGRAELMEAELEIRSGPGEGTTVSLKVRIA
jgi:signal transduction histidine kinase